MKQTTYLDWKSQNRLTLSEGKQLLHAALCLLEPDVRRHELADCEQLALERAASKLQRTLLVAQNHDDVARFVGFES